jgi:hypothetical protein
MSPLFRSTNQHYQIKLATYCLPYIRLTKTPNHYIFTLKMATAMFTQNDGYFLNIRRGSSPKAEDVQSYKTSNGIH